MRNLFSMLAFLILLTGFATWQLYSSWGQIDLSKVPFPPLADTACDVSSDDSECVLRF